MLQRAEAAHLLFVGHVVLHAAACNGPLPNGITSQVRHIQFEVGQEPGDEAIAGCVPLLGPGVRLKVAETLYRGGNTKFGIPACMSCHGPAGAGIGPNYPAVSGQQAAYTAKQLTDFKSGARSNDGNVMTQIAFLLSESQIKAVSEYMAGLH